MATGAAADGLFRSVYSGSISGYDNCVERRPYHRNCGCALHNNKSPSNNNNCTHKLPRSNNVSYPLRRAWSEGNLVLAASSYSHHSSSPSPSPSSSDLQLIQLRQEENN
ncbi:hypothetical protein RIF29_07592 [Crotalaria pallida]|uniref:Uncharacterized protein n=1 Tax=Crotalaria pallida TaxID=3830 RepID=A0AAN9J5G0_CROPI